MGKAFIHFNERLFKMEKTFMIGQVAHDLKKIAFFYGSLMAKAFPGRGNLAAYVIAHLPEDFRDIEALENILHKEYTKLLCDYHTHKEIAPVLADLCILYRELEFHPHIKEYIMNKEGEFPSSVIEDIRLNLLKKRKKSAAALLVKIMTIYEQLRHEEFVEQQTRFIGRINLLIMLEVGLSD